MKPDQYRPSPKEIEQQEYATVLLRQFAQTFRALGREGIARLNQVNMHPVHRDAAETALCNADEYIYTIATRRALSTTVSPRPIDIAGEFHFIRGNHAGAYIEYKDVRTKERAVITLSGGLRDPQAYYDENIYDSDWALRRNHPQRTDRIIEKPISLNFHFFPAHQNTPLVQAEIRVGVQTVNLSGLTYENRTLPVYPKIPRADARFEEIAAGMRTAVKQILTTVPNHYYPL